MSEVIKQLKIKTSMLIRLKKQYESYEKQTKSFDKKVEEISNGVITQQSKFDLKKNKEFLEESQSVLSNVKHKLIQAFEGLAMFLKEKDQQIQASPQKSKAQEVILEVENFLECLTE